MTESEIIAHIAALPGVDVVTASKENGAPEMAWGDTFFSYDPERNLPPEHRFPFATLVTQDYAGFDEASNLNRPGVFRLNVGLSRDRVSALFPEAGATHDFTVFDRLMPHPVYAAQGWVCVLNPSEETFEAVKPLIAEAHAIAVRRLDRRSSGSPQA